MIETSRWLILGLLTLIAACAPTNPPMAGCGMMIDGKMVYSNSNPCMNMNKPGNMMPNGVTMHTDPAAKP